MADHRTRRSPTTSKNEPEPRDEIRGAELEPIRHVNRELTRPDGTKLVVKVPVYPPFRLRDHAPEKEQRRRKHEPEKKAS